MAENTTLEEIKEAERARGEARLELKAAEEVIMALSEGSRANIDGIHILLSAEGGVVLENTERNAAPWRLTERQFLGLMGWGRKHVGDGPNGKSKDEPESR